MKRLLCLLLILLYVISVTAITTCATDSELLMATDCIDLNSADVSCDIQNMIDSNPNRTIYFPDGVYNLSNSIFTPADPKKSVDLQLSNYAVFKANDDFKGEALVRLGGKDSYNTTSVNGSNYSLTGGIIDGSGIANGVSIDSGRETKISNVSIKNTIVGIKIKYGANSGSSDSDIFGCNITGTGTTDSIGILVEGYDNTITNVRINNVFIGMYINSAGNSFTNIHPLYTSDYTDYENSCGFYDKGNSNTYNYCYSDQFCTGFYIERGVNIYTDCFAYWYSASGGREIVFRTDNCFDSKVSGIQIGFRDDTYNTLLETHGIGSGCLDRVDYDPSKCCGFLTYEWYMTDSLLYRLKCCVFTMKRFIQSAVSFIDQISY